MHIDALKASQKAADEKAVEMVAKLGIAPMAVDAKAGASLTRAEALTEYSRLLTANKNREAGEFYKTHRELITK